jgi:MFS transporter, FHS family, glucose/mannose:H+ symporter
MPEPSPDSVRLQRAATLAAHVAFVPTGIVTVLLGPLLPSLSARWGLTDTQAGDLFTAQFAASTVGVFLSGVLVPRLGYRLAIVLGVAWMGFGVDLLPLPAWPLGLGAVAVWGLGLGVCIPACNLLVAEVHPQRSGAALSLLNFTWSAGAVACPILLAPFEHRGAVFFYLELLAGALLVIAVSLAALPLPLAHGRKASPARATPARSSSVGFLEIFATPLALVIAALFFLYTGVENSVGGWVASYAKRIATGGGMLWVAAPSFFYFALLIGRGVAAPVLRRVSELRLARIGLGIAVSGIVALLASNSIAGVLVSASVTGLGLAAVYPITIAIMTRTVGRSSPGISSMMFALAGLGAACVPWLVGFESTQQASLKAGLGVALGACVVMLGLYLQRWPAVASAPSAESPQQPANLVN